MNRCSTWRWKPSVTKRLARSKPRPASKALSRPRCGLLRRSTGVGPYEGAKVQVQSNGKVSVATGIGTQGQGHFTVLAQIAAISWGSPSPMSDVVTGDTDQFYWGRRHLCEPRRRGRGNAVNEASKVVRKKALKLASDLFECAEEDLVLEDAKSPIVGIPKNSSASPI